jgi:hypothetical protein
MMPKFERWSLPLLAALVLAPAQRGSAETVSALFARGYTVLPTPQNVSLSGKDLVLTREWRLEFAHGVVASDVAVESLKEDLLRRYGLELAAGGAKQGAAGVIRLAVAARSVTIAEAADRNRDALADQAYRLTLSPREIGLTANAPPGLFYGVQTLLQLVTPAGSQLRLPQGEIVDWPDLELRTIYWDDAHHLEHPDVLKAALRQAAFYKINGFAIKLEGHFQYSHAAPMVEPYALTPAELQELTDYGLRYHVQLIPYLDGPAHVAFILKHPEYARLREFLDSNYELCATNPDTYKLLFGMYQDLLDANRGGKYFVLSTDEPYFAGIANNAQCDEVSRAKQLGSNGKLLAEFVTKTAGYLHDRGRQVFFWGEYPLQPDDISALPNYLINGEIYGPKFDPVFKAHGIRQTVFTSTVGWKEFLFPNYYLRPSTQTLPGPPGGAYEPTGQGPGIVTEMFNLISFTSERERADLMGSFVAGWADTGLHPETFWLGYATGSAAAWRPGTPDPRELMASFYRLFYGPSAVTMGRLYQLMSEQAQFWKESWTTAASNARTPIWGDYPREIFTPPHPAEDQTLPFLPIPSPELLALNYDWSKQNIRRLELASQFLAQNDELLDLLHQNLERVEFNRYNLEVYLAIAQLFRQNLQMLLQMDQIDAALLRAEAAAGRAQPARAIAAVDSALNLSEEIWQQRNSAFHDAAETWHRSWYPRVAEANGRSYLDKVDDVKDHLPVRTIDMTYLVYRELLYPLGEWAEQVRAARNHYARAHNLPLRTDQLDWKDTKTVRLVERPNAEEED